MQKIDVKIDDIEAKEVESNLLGLVTSNQSKELSTTTASKDVAAVTFEEVTILSLYSLLPRISSTPLELSLIELFFPHIF